MIYRHLSGMGLKLSRIGLGGEQLGGFGWHGLSEEELSEAVARAVEVGINLFDTSPSYGLGHSEEVLGRVLGASRKDVVLASKIGQTWRRNEKNEVEMYLDCSPANIRRQIDASLRRLNTDYLDIYQIHWPDPAVPIEDTMAAMEALRKAGKIRFIGCCNFPMPLLKIAMRCAPVSVVQAPYNLIDRDVEQELLPFCDEENIAVLAYTPIAKGLLSGKYDTSVRFGPDDRRSRHKYFRPEEMLKSFEAVERVKIVAGRMGKTPAQVALRWVLENPRVTSTLVGVKNTAQLQENVAALDLTLSKEDLDFLGAGK